MAPRKKAAKAPARAKKSAAKKAGPQRLKKAAILKAAKTPAKKRATKKSTRRARTAPPPGDVTQALELDLQRIAKRDPQLAKSALAASARQLAKELDSPGNSATSKSMCARVFLDTLNRLVELAPEEEPQDGLDDLAAKRAARLAGRSGT